MKAALVTLTALLACSLALAQSSGNFTYGNTGDTHCVLNSNGTITGGTTCSAGTCATSADCSALGGTEICANIGANGLGTCERTCSSNGDCAVGQTCTAGVCGGGCAGSLNAAIKTNSGTGNVFVVRPSAVIGLLTDVSLQKNATISVGTSSALAGVDFKVVATGIRNQPQPCITPNFAVTYAARFIQISSNLFNLLGTTCTTLQAGQQAIGCFFNFSESTVSAHSFDWIVGSPAAANPQPAGCSALASGEYGITANWTASLGNTGIAQSLTCVGPVNLTVQQNKIFQFNTVN